MSRIIGTITVSQLRTYREGYQATIAAMDLLTARGYSGPVNNPYVPGTGAYRAWNIGSDCAINELDMIEGSATNAAGNGSGNASHGRA